MKLLVIEDEPEINNALCSFFKTEGFEVESARGYLEAYDKIGHTEYDCILLALSLPDGDGLDLIRQLKIQDSPACIIVISSRDSLDDKIKGLDLGADDYLSKPFCMAELHARIKSVLRRSHWGEGNQTVFNEIKVIPACRQVFIHNQEVQLTPKEFALLHYFILNKNRVLTKDNLVNHLCDEPMGVSVPSYDFIYTHIRNLRHKITQAGGNDYIQSIYSIGYRFAEP